MVLEVVPWECIEMCVCCFHWLVEAFFWTCWEWDVVCDFHDKALLFSFASDHKSIFFFKRDAFICWGKKVPPRACRADS